MPESYQGHPSYEHWNVSLWVSNDEALYQNAMLCQRAEQFADIIRRVYGFVRTPDGVRVTPALAAYAWECLDDTHD